MRLTLISGMSGSGKSTALKTLEDLGYYCMDNLPLPLIPGIVDWYGKEFDDDLLAVCADTRAKSGFDDPARHIARIEEDGVEISVLFLDARDDVLIRRFSETRRSHPLALGKDATLVEALSMERDLLHPLRSRGFVVDTSFMRGEELRERVRSYANLDKEQLGVSIFSFGFKYGLPIDLDFCFDARHLPNPYWEPSLRRLKGTDPEIREFFRKIPETESYVDDLADFMTRRIRDFDKGVRSYLSFGVGCTGGRHRSVYVVERVADRVRSELGRELVVRHRDIGR